MRGIPSVLALVAGLLATLAPAEARRSRAPDPRSLEYRLSWGLGEIGVQRAYRQGGSGNGVVVAMVDTGLSGASSLFARLSPASIDLVEGRMLGDGGADHGRQTATLLAAVRDGAGTMGVAYGATLLEIRADHDGSCRSICSMTGETLARGIDYAVDHGAQVIGLPLASYRPLPAIEDALSRAAGAGVLIVAAAGNDGGREPVWPARYAADPRFRDSVLVAGAGTRTRQLARWSNRAGSTADRYLVAPGERVLVDCGTLYCGAVSGTSFSVSYVAGAAALLLERRPDLSGAQAGEFLLAAARGAGEPEATAGQGTLDVGRAARLADQGAARSGALRTGRTPDTP